MATASVGVGERGRVGESIALEVIALEVVTNFEEVVARMRAGDLAAVAVDMPIGLPTTERRASDGAARALLGPRRSSVFPTPIRAVLDEVDHETASARSRALSGRGISIQAWNLAPRIREVDGALTPTDQECVREAHPELAIARLLGHPAVHPKRTAAGRTERLVALGDLASWATGPTPRGAAPDDVIDALALTTTAQRMVTGEVVALGDGALDDRGFRLEVLY